MMHRAAPSLGMSPAPRGFVLLVVVMLLAVLAVLATSQLSSLQGQELLRIRAQDEFDARAAAERCIEAGRVYVAQWQDAQGTKGDFDRLLDPDSNSAPVANGGTADFSNDFIPAASMGGHVVYVPAAEASASDALRKALHRYRLLEWGETACLLRFDDNSDDAGAGSVDFTDNNNTGTLEGTGRDIPYRDRDVGISISAIGISPYRGEPASAYADARARVGLKSFVTSGGAPGVVAGAQVRMGQNVSVCGVGGLYAKTLTYQGGGSADDDCGCGDIMVESNTVVPPERCNYAESPGNQCDPSVPCQPGVTVTGAVVSPPVIEVPGANGFHFLELQGFHDPNDARGLGNNGVCEFYFADKTGSSPHITHGDGEVYVWDHTDTAAVGCDKDYGFAPGMGQTETACTSAGGTIVKHDCSEPDMDGAGTLDHTPGGLDIVKRPCEWRPDADPTKNGPRVICTPEETPCWKLQARVFASNDTRQVVQQDYSTAIDGGGASPQEWLKEQAKYSGSSRSRIFQPRNGQRIPNIASMPTRWTDYCGGCQNCDGSQDGWQINGGGGNGGHWHFEESPFCATDFIDPAILVFDNAFPGEPGSTDSRGDRFHVKENWGVPGSCGGRPVRASLLIRGHADIAEGMNLCSPWADCSTFPITPCAVEQLDKARGYAVRAGGQCYMNQKTITIGDVQCGTIHIKTGSGVECLLGNYIAFDPTVGHPLGVECATDNAFAECSEGMCVRQGSTFAGNIISAKDVCIDQGLTIQGSVLAGEDLFMEQDSEIKGQVVTVQNMGLKQRVVINNGGSGLYGERVGRSMTVETSH